MGSRISKDRVAVIEIGSSAVRLLIGYRAGDRLVAIRQQDPDASLLDLLENDGASPTRGVGRVRAAVDSFANAAKNKLAVHPSRLLIFGTEAARRLRVAAPIQFAELTRGFDILRSFERPRAWRGYRFLLLTERDEAYFSLVTAIRALPGVDGSGASVLVVDQGAGSIEAAVGHRVGDRIKLGAYVSHPLGSRMLLEKFRELGCNFGRFRDWLLPQAAGMLPTGAASASGVVLIGTSISTVAWRTAQGEVDEKYDPAIAHGRTLDASFLENFVTERIKSSLSAEKDSYYSFSTRGNLENVVGVVALQIVLSRVPHSEFIVCAEGARYGVAWELTDLLT